MSRFAKDIMEMMTDLCQRLEVILGPDTGMQLLLWVKAYAISGTNLTHANVIVPFRIF